MYIMNRVFNRGIRVFSHVRLDRDTTKIYVRTTHYDDFKKMLPYSEWNELFAESYPMHTWFTIPKSKEKEAYDILVKNGYREM